MRYYISLGTNMGDRLSNTRRATAYLKTIGTVLKISSIYETSPVAMAPDAKDFYNLVLCLDSKLSPHELLKATKGFEKKMGRDVSSPAASHNKPRTMDIDIVLAEDHIIDSEELTIPHKEMHQRKFVLIPLNEIAPQAIHPVLNREITEILSHLHTPGVVTKI
ncbi:MAG: 2-amino-4-hydroxy-6-hydroxymethyldihydropteridine diphosphokinase [Acidobacteria bacterium]|jgi:2-amino-4-hydroxy-6-hydroxymethyldihydropteridine diphosphokinase|nr:2-amino-4-hydroxy-6-hydroxymethyldihydropteridine diphosphokinase [Acidobacteriota bacterium]